MGLGCVKTPARHDALELRSHSPTVGAPRARLASRRPLVEGVRNPQTPRFMQFRRAGHVPRTILLRTHWLRDLPVSWNRILAIFDPYTFSRSQGQIRKLGAFTLPCFLFV